MKHTITLVAENSLGCLVRIAGLFSGRGYNIDTITLGKSEEDGYVRMTLVTHGDDRIIEQMVEDFYKSVAERAREAFFPLLEQGRLKGIIVGGPGYSKKDFVKGDYLDTRLRKKLIGSLVDVSYQGDAGLRELVMKAEEAIEGHRYIEAVKKVEELKTHMAKDDGLAVFGEDEVKAAAEMGALGTLIIVEDHPRFEELRQIAEKTGAKIVSLPSTMPEGSWLQSAFGGVAGILRFKIY